MVACVHIAAHAVFGAVECHKVHVGRLVQDVNGGPHPVVPPRALVSILHAYLPASEILFFQYLDTGLYSDLLCLHRTSAKEAEQGYNNSPLHNQSLNITHKTLIINH